MKAILLDIEGTTTPIDFVHKRLFPFAAARIDAFLASNWTRLGDEIEALEREYHLDFQNQLYGRAFRADSPESVGAYLKFLTEVDRKSTPLKSIQGAIWQSGYQAGDLRSEMFADVKPAFEPLEVEGKTIAIFSSGSVLAQKLIFRHSADGDLTLFISSYFDTRVGPKREPSSYSAIARELELKAPEILFVSDVIAELDAAADAGMQTLLSVRPGNGRVKAPIEHDAVGSFEGI